MPDLRPDDVFYVIGFTGEDIVGGAQLRAMQLSAKNLEMVGILQQPFGDLEEAAKHGFVVKRMIEVYYLDFYSIESPYGRKYLVVEYYNETAFVLSNLFEIELPPVIGKLTRAELPKHLRTGRKAISFALPPVH
jgi:hypothetical protein